MNKWTYLKFYLDLHFLSFKIEFLLLNITVLSEIIEYWWVCGAIGTFLYFPENANWGNRLGITVWHYLVKLKLHVLCDLAILHLSDYTTYETHGEWQYFVCHTGIKKWEAYTYKQGTHFQPPRSRPCPECSGLISQHLCYTSGLQTQCNAVSCAICEYSFSFIQ